MRFCGWMLNSAEIKYDQKKLYSKPLSGMQQTAKVFIDFSVKLELLYVKYGVAILKLTTFSIYTGFIKTAHFL
jgi:hypothetical protein